MQTCQGPHPAPRKPHFTLPPRACDAHCHVFGPVETFPYAPERRYTPPDAPKERLAQLHDMLGIERAVIVQASCHGKDNRAMLDAIAASPSRRRGIAIVDDGIAERDLADLHAGGVRGVRFNFVKHLGGAPEPRRFAASSIASAASDGTSSCISMLRIWWSCRPCCGRSPCLSSSTTWAASRRRKA